MNKNDEYSNKEQESLIQEHYLMNALMDYVPDHIYFKDLECRFIRNNKTHAQSFGFSDPGLIVGMSDFDFFVKEVAQRQYDDEQEIIRTGKTINKEEFTIRSDNSVNWYVTTKMPLRDEGGKIVGTFGISKDITERKKVEEELRKLSMAVEQSPVSIVITNIDGNIEYANPKACETTGYSLEELLGKNPRVLKSGETTSDEYEFLWSSISSGNHWKGTFHNKKKNGELYWESSTIAPIKDSNGKITHYIALKEDITERRLVEKALQESETLLRGFFDLPLIGHAITSPVKGWLEINSSLCNMLGYTKVELMSLTWDKLTHPDDLAADITQFNRILNRETDSYSMEKRFIHKDGHVVFTHLAVQCKRNADQTVNYFMAVVVDISDIKRAEEEIRQKNEDLVKANAEKDRFFSIIAHDLRSPFNGFLNLTKIMSEEVHELSLIKIQQLATTMSQSAAKLYDMLENLLEWSRMQRGLTDFKPVSIALNSTVQNYLQVLADFAIEKGITIKVHVPEDLKIYADEKMIESTLRNLMSNAIKFTTRGGRVTLTAKASDDQSVIISVTDTGIGMPQDLLNKLFRIDQNPSRKGTAGESSSGLGLLLCKDFIEKHGGTIWVESEVNKGSTFFVKLPNQRFHDA